MTLEFPGEIVASIIEQRLKLSPDGISEELKAQLLQQITHILAYGLSINIYMILTTDQCTTLSDCKNTYSFECWNIQRLKVDELKTNATIPPPLLPIFLKNAIQSQLHFSPINSWISKNGGIFPSGLKCSYRISANNNNTLTLPEGQIETHTFPLCKFETSTPENGEFLVVNVKWIRLPEFPKHDSECCRSIKESWVLPIDGLPNSTEDDEEDFNSSSSSSPSFPSFPNNHSSSTSAKTISKESEVQVLADFLSLSSIQPFPEKRKRYKRKSTSSSKDDDDEGDVDPIITRRRRRSRQCTAVSMPAEDSSLSTRPRACKSFSGISTATFNPKTRLPLNSSPSPLKRTPMNLASKLRAKFLTLDGDSSSSDSEYIGAKNSTIYGSSQSNNALLCNFEESALNGRLEPISSIEGFKLQLAVSGSFNVPHTIIPVTTYFFNVSDDNAPSLYLGHCSFKDSPFGRKAVHIPKKCIVQATLFNPQGSVVRIFIVRIDVADIPPRSRTFIRQRTYQTPMDSSNISAKFLRYLINLRLATDRSGKLYLHTDVRLLFSNNHTDIDVMNLIASKKNTTTSDKRGTLTTPSSNLDFSPTYELITTTEMPPKYSPIK